MADVVLGHPYSGALYAYFSDEIGGESSHTRIAQTHPYYRALYGRHYESYIEFALTFLLLYDNVWVAPADNHMPISKSEPWNRNYIPELGLHANLDDYTSLTYSERENYIQRFLADAHVQHILYKVLKVPSSVANDIIRSAMFEAGLSAHKRIPLLCSRGRRALIERMIAVGRPSLYPIVPTYHGVTFIQSYRELTGMALGPKSLDDLMHAKPDQAVRKYGSRFLKIALDHERTEKAVATASVAHLIREAIETERVSRLFTGLLKWAATLLRLARQTPAAGIATIGGFVANKIGEGAGWYEFSGSIDRAIDRAQLLRKVEEEAVRASQIREPD